MKTQFAQTILTITMPSEHLCALICGGIDPVQGHITVQAHRA